MVQDFSAAFYNALIVAGETVQSAFLIARENINAAAVKIDTGFVLLPEGKSRYHRGLERYLLVSCINNSSRKEL